MLIERPPRWFRSFFPGAVFRLPSLREGEKRVFLTFDDGPIPEVTPFVLEVLDKADVKATFFMVGQNVERYPHLLDEIRAGGHEVGNHTLHHIKGLRVSPKEYLEDASHGERLTGSQLFRPPHGWLSKGQLRCIRRHYDVVMFDLITRDYSRHLNSGDVIQNVKKFTRDGSIIVFHDSLKSLPRLREALPESIRWLKEQGFEFQLIGEQLKKLKK